MATRLSSPRLKATAGQEQCYGSTTRVSGGIGWDEFFRIDDIDIAFLYDPDSDSRLSKFVEGIREPLDRF